MMTSTPPANKDRAGAAPKIRSLPDLVRKEFLAALVALAAVCLISAVFDAPVQGPADPEGIPSDNVKAPWIFVGIQQMLRYLPPLVAGVAIPFAALVLLASVPYLSSEKLLSRNTIRAVFSAIVLAAACLTLWGYLV